jgi:hypothetical protein
MEGCEIQGIFRDRLRVDGKLTNCETGDRLVISKLFFFFFFFQIQDRLEGSSEIIPAWRL